MTVGVQPNPFQVFIQAAQQPLATLTLIAITQAILTTPLTSLINSDLDSKERLCEFFNWVKKIA